MSDRGASAELLVRARAALLDAMEALSPHHDGVILVGAQAVYLHTGRIEVALAEATKDSDVAIDPRVLPESPLIEDAMRSAGFLRGGQPGAWFNADGVPVDLMVPEMLAGGGGRRGVRIPPHAKYAARRTIGLEAAVVDHGPMTVRALGDDDRREVVMNVAGPAALLVAKLHKIGERVETPGRLQDKDAHDVYRLLRAVETGELADRFAHLTASDVAADVTETALQHLEVLFAAGPSAIGAEMAGRAEELVGDPDVVSASVSLLADDLVRVLRPT
jgi:hypothetical protein